MVSVGRLSSVILFTTVTMFEITKDLVSLVSRGSSHWIHMNTEAVFWSACFFYYYYYSKPSSRIFRGSPPLPQAEIKMHLNLWHRNKEKVQSQSRFDRKLHSHVQSVFTCLENPVLFWGFFASKGLLKPFQSSTILPFHIELHV